MRPKTILAAVTCAAAVPLTALGVAAQADPATIDVPADAVVVGEDGRPGEELARSVEPPGSRDPELEATVLNGDQVRIEWRSDRTDVIGWNVARDGGDDFGPGTWDRDVAAGLRAWTFNSLIGGSGYTFTLTPLTASGPGEPVTVAATPTDRPAAPAARTPGDGTTAAGRLGWGAPLPASDEFSYTGAPDPAKWSTPDGCWPGHAGNGRRCEDRSTVAGGRLIQTGLADGDSAWVASRFDQRFGRWEARVRSFNTGAGGHEYHPLLIVWPESDRWPEDGEYDFLENDAPGAPCAEAYLHHPHPEGPVQQEKAEERAPCGAPLSEWHNVAFEWTPDHLKGFIDGAEWFSVSGGAGPGGRGAIQAMPSGHLTIQLDNFAGDGMRAAAYEVDWVRIYRAG